MARRTAPITGASSAIGAEPAKLCAAAATEQIFQAEGITGTLHTPDRATLRPLW